MIHVKVKKLSETAVLPLRATSGAAGYDLFSNEPVTLEPSACCVVGTGISVELPPRCEMQIRSRSGLAVKQQIFVLNSPGTIDSDYRGEIKVVLFNLSRQTQTFPAGAKIAQAVVVGVPEVVYTEAGNLNTTERGSSGFGHSGV